MKIQNVIWIFPVAAAVVLTTAKASVVDETTVDSSVNIGKVSIAVSETMIDEDGAEVPYVPSPIICPGETVSNIKKVTNTGGDCWLRLDLENTGELTLTDDFFHSFDSDKWVKKEADGGHTYYYYKDKFLSDSEPITLFDGITFPSSWGNDESGKEISYSLSVEAVQAKNISPDFDADSPWGDITPIEYQEAIQP